MYEEEEVQVYIRILRTSEIFYYICSPIIEAFKFPLEYLQYEELDVMGSHSFSTYDSYSCIYMHVEI